MESPLTLDTLYQVVPLATGVAWLIASCSCKLSILYLYMFIFVTRSFRIAAKTIVLVVAAYGFTFLCVFLARCRPISYSWSLNPGTHCRDISVEEIVSVTLNMVIDTIIVILPMIPLWGLQMATRRKFALSGLFSLGLLCVYH